MAAVLKACWPSCCRFSESECKGTHFFRHTQEFLSFFSILWFIVDTHQEKVHKKGANGGEMGGDGIAAYRKGKRKKKKKKRREGR